MSLSPIFHLQSCNKELGTYIFPNFASVFRGCIYCWKWNCRFQGLPYLKKLLIQLASSRLLIHVSFANFFLVVHFGSRSLCDGCWESWSEPASGSRRGRTYHAAGFRILRGTAGRGKGLGRSGARPWARSSCGVGGVGSEPVRERRGWWRRRQGKRRSVSGAGPGRSPNLANLCGYCHTRPWPWGGPGGGACAR